MTVTGPVRVCWGSGVGCGELFRGERVLQRLLVPAAATELLSEFLDLLGDRGKVCAAFTLDSNRDTIRVKFLVREFSQVHVCSVHAGDPGGVAGMASFVGNETTPRTVSAAVPSPVRAP